MVKKKELDKSVINWLNLEIEYAERDMEEAEYRAQEYSDALERYKKRGSLPKDIRMEYKNSMGEIDID